MYLLTTVKDNGHEVIHWNLLTFILGGRLDTMFEIILTSLYGDASGMTYNSSSVL